MFRKVSISCALWMVCFVPTKAQFSSGLDAIHEATSNLFREATSASIGTWANGVLGTTEAININGNPSISQFVGTRSASDLQRMRNDVQSLPRTATNQRQLNTELTDVRRLIRESRENYLAQRSIAFVYRNSPQSAQYLEAARLMRIHNDALLEDRIYRGHLIEHARTRGFALNNAGTSFISASNQSSMRTPATSNSRPQTAPNASRGSRSEPGRGGMMSGVRSTWQRVRGAFGAFGRFLRRFGPRGRGGRLHESVAIDKFNTPQPKQPAIISIYPNPAVDYVNIKLNQEFQNIHIQLYDLQGRMVLRLPIPGNQGIHGFQLSSLDLTKGVYILNIIQDNQRLATEKIYIK